MMAKRYFTNRFRSNKHAAKLINKKIEIHS